MKVLVTGAFGWTAKSILEQLYESNYRVVALDIANKIPVYLHGLTNEIFIGDIASIDDVRKAMVGCDYVIHLAIAASEGDYESAEIPFKINVKGTYNVFEVAKELKIKKVILMSEAPVHVEIDKNEVFTSTEKWRSRNGEDHLYDLTKRLQECIAKDYCETYDMDVVVLRPGHIVDGKNSIDPTGRSLKELIYCRGGWVCRYDLATACLHALQLKRSGYNSFHIIGSWQARSYFDIEKTENILKLTFACTFEEF